MVNGNKTGLSTKAFILDKLRDEGRPLISGEALGGSLGISRVAVWKAVRALREAGYSLEGDDRGYRFTGTGGEDFLYPWEFGQKEGFFRHWETTDSTMNRARELACRGFPGGTVITAETQTAGKGRNGRRWVSKPGGLFFTLLERPALAAADYTQLTPAIHIALGKVIAGICGKRALLRWPNDVYVEGKKIAGFLTDLSVEGDRIRWMAIGMGVNINNASPSPGIAHCAKFLGRPVSRRETLLAILGEIENALKTQDTLEERRRWWNREAEGIGQRVLVLETECGKRETPGKERIIAEGVFQGIDCSGRGLVKTDGGIKRFSPGPVSLRLEPFTVREQF
jgi:BirA family biotin operon repressor/biotin-[acetyl-CoA-carboxylase] ligase